MNEEKMRSLLAGKIDSLDKWKAVCAEANMRWNTTDYGFGYTNTFHYGRHDHMGAAHSMPDIHRWWLVREQLRMNLGVYPEASDVLAHVAINAKLGAYCVHVSREDPTMVAYTPSMEDGMRDKQVRISFGKLLRKLVPLLTDTHIQYLEATHRSELDPTFQVARTTDEIETVYTTMAGDGACMRHAPSNWNLPGDIHPSHAYSYAGLGVAYSTNGDGVANARSVIYENPDNPDDKRYVRVYGDLVLERKLKRAGYKLSSLQGAKLRAIDLRKSETAKALGTRDINSLPFVVPYLDGAGGAQSQEPGSYGYIVKGEDCIRLIDGVQARRLATMGHAAPRFKSTAVRYKVPEVNAADLNFTCALTGKEVNGLEVEQTLVFKDGQLVRAARHPALNEFNYDRTVHALREGCIVSVLVTQEDREAKCWYDSGTIGGYVLDTPEARAHCGFVPLDPDTYPTTKWGARAKCIDRGGKWYLMADCHLVFDADGVPSYVLSADLVALRKNKNYVSIAPRGERKAMSHRSNPRLVTTVGGRKCVSGWHDVTELWDGGWEYTSNTTSAAFMGSRMVWSVKRPVITLAVRLTEAQVVTRMGDVFLAASKCRDLESKKSAMYRNVGNFLNSGIGGRHYYLTGDVLFRGGWTSPHSLESLRGAADRIAAMTDEQLVDIWDVDTAVSARTWQYHASLILKIADAKLAEWTPAPVCTPEGWTTWNGGSRPVDAHVQVEALLRSGEKVIERSDDLYWTHVPGDNAIDIVAYRLAPPEVAPAAETAPPDAAAIAVNAIDELLTLTATHIQGERLASAA